MLWYIWSVVVSQWAFWIALAAHFLYRRIMAPYSYFSDRGIVFDKPTPIFGNFGKMMLAGETIYETLMRGYNQFAGKRFYGIYDFSRPLLTIRDPELIRQITVKDFDHFADHRPFFADTQSEPLFGRSLFMLTGQNWRDMRATLSPAFTGHKMRQMFQLVVECSEQATAILLADARAAAPAPFVPEMKDLFTRFTNDVIATTAFGVRVNSLLERDNEFYRMGKSATNFSNIKLIFKMMMMGVLPKLSKALGIRMFDRKQAGFYHSLVHDTIRTREREGIIRPDMIHLLMEARKGQLKADVQPLATPADDAGYATVDEVAGETLQGQQKLKWEDDDLTAQCFLFFIAGFETSATLLCFAAHELMENRDVQDRLIAEVDAAKAKLAGKPMCYDELQRLQYLDQVVSETLRKWPPAVAMDRQCQKTYRMTDESGHTVTLEKGDAVWLPALAIHRDPQYWPEPERFDPERFSDERKRDIVPFTYMPFGQGPRNCIGSRFALMECKAFLFYLLSNFTFEVAATSTVPIVLEGSSFALKAKGGFNIQLKPRV